MMAAVSSVMFGGEKEQLGVMVCGVCEDSILDISTQEPFLREWRRVLLRVDSPPVHAPKEERSVVANFDLLIEVVFKELLRFSSSVHCISIYYFKLFTTLSLRGVWWIRVGVVMDQGWGLVDQGWGLVDQGWGLVDQGWGV